MVVDVKEAPTEDNTCQESEVTGTPETLAVDVEEVTVENRYPKIKIMKKIFKFEIEKPFKCIDKDEKKFECVTKNASYEESNVAGTTESPIIDISSSDEEEDASNNITHQNEGEESVERKTYQKRTLEIVKPVMDFLKCGRCSYVTTENAMFLDHITSQHGKSNCENVGTLVRHSSKETATTEHENGTNSSQSGDVRRQNEEIGREQRGRKRSNKRTLVAPRAASDFIRCNNCIFVTTDKATMSEHAMSHSREESGHVGENEKGEDNDEKREKHTKQKVVLKASRCILTQNWQKKFTDFVGTVESDTEFVPDGSTLDKSAVEEEDIPNALVDASCQNPEGDVEESPVMVEDIQESVEIEADENANFQS